MTATTHADGRLPLDVHTRQRLREAQNAEGQAVKAVCSAQAAVDSARAKRDSLYAAANRIVERAENRLTSAQAQLVEVSGLDRAAGLLGANRNVLRRAIATAREPQGAAAEAELSQ